MEQSRFQAIPILRIFDRAKAREFYVGFLSFQVDWTQGVDETAPVYMQVSRDTLILHFSEHHGDCCPGSTVFVHTTHLAQFHQELTAKDYPYMRPGIERTPWHAHVMEVIDPFGNRLRFHEALDAADKRQILWDNCAAYLRHHRIAGAAVCQAWPGRCRAGHAMARSLAA